METAVEKALSPAQDRALGAIVKQLGKNFGTLPGWSFLLTSFYIVASMAPPGAQFYGLDIKEHRDLIVGFLTLVFYWIGDAFDKPIFRKFEDSRLDRLLGFVRQPRKDSRTELQVEEDIYRVSMDLLVAAKKYEGSWIWLCNESAKFLRSAALPIILWPQLQLPMSLGPSWGRVLLAASVFGVYILLKPLHMRLLYKKVEKLVKSGKKSDPKEPTAPPKYKKSVACTNNDIRLFFWKEKLVSSAIHSASAKTAVVTEMSITQKVMGYSTLAVIIIGGLYGYYVSLAK